MKPRANGILLNENKWTYTYYVRDASGNVMTVYNKAYTDSGSPFTETFSMSEHHLYGSSRLGTDNHLGETALASRTFTASFSGVNFTSVNVTNSTTAGLASTTDLLHWLGKRNYELNNHLGNVLVAVSDRWTAIDNGSDGTIDLYNANVVSAQNYYAFGMIMPGKSYSSDKYRYGFNGKEKDDEGLGGGGSTYDYGFRIYNPAIGRFLSIDPLTKGYPELTPYQFASNSPIENIDLDGLEATPALGLLYEDMYKVQQPVMNAVDITQQTVDNAIAGSKAATGSFLDNNGQTIQDVSMSVSVAGAVSCNPVGEAIAGPAFQFGTALKTTSDAIDVVTNLAEWWAKDDNNKLYQALGNFVVNKVGGALMPDGIVNKVGAEWTVDVAENIAEVIIDKVAPENTNNANNASNDGDHAGDKTQQTGKTTTKKQDSNEVIIYPVGSDQYGER
jgi:RHS repeat-associated protein